jgi:predicted transcriptional regulator
MTTISVKVPKKLAQQVDRAARQRRVSKSALIREAIARLLGDQKQPRRFVSAYELAKDFCGIAKNTPRDIATNPKYMEGFGE